MIKDLILVFLGGGIGSLGRYSLSLWLAKYQHLYCYHFPIHTFIANALGCFLIGLAIGFCMQNPNKWINLLFVVGFCGGFTTFSTFSLEIINLLKTGQILISLIYLSTSLILCLTMNLLGIYLIKN